MVFGLGITKQTGPIWRGYVKPIMGAQPFPDGQPQYKPTLWYSKMEPYEFVLTDQTVSHPQSLPG